MAVCGAYAIRPYTGTRKNGDFSICSTTGVAVCGAYAIRPYPTGQKFIGVLVRFYLMNQKSDRDWIRSAPDVFVCGAYAIRPYPTGRKFIGVSVCFYPGNEIIVIFSGTRVGAYCIRPTNGHANGRMSGKIDRVSVRFYPMKTKMAGDSMVRNPRKGVWGCSIVVVRFLDHMPGLHFEITVDYIDG